MLSGSELRNLFNIHMRKLYSAKDSTGRASGRSGSLIVNSKTDIDLFFEKCYDILDNYDKIKELTNDNILDFLNEFVYKISYLLEHYLEEETIKLTKKLSNEFIEEIKKNSDIKVHKDIDKKSKIIQNLEGKIYEPKSFIKSKKVEDDFIIAEIPVETKTPKKDKKAIKKKEFENNRREVKKIELRTEINNLISLLTNDDFFIDLNNKLKELLNELDNTKNLENVQSKFHKFKTRYERLKNKNNNPIKRNQGKKNNKSFHKNKFKSKSKEEFISNNTDYTEKIKRTPNHKFNFKKYIVILFILCIVGFGIYYSYNLLNTNSPIIIQNQTNLPNETKTELAIEPPAPVLEEFKLSDLENEVFDGINNKRIKYGKSKYKLNLKLSEINYNYLKIGLQENFEIAKNKIGDLSIRGERGNVNSGLVESQFEFNNNLNVDEMINQIKNSNLYLEEYKNMAITIIEKDNKYYILLDIYKD